jgi:hypothetical protein
MNVYVTSISFVECFKNMCMTSKPIENTCLHACLKNMHASKKFYCTLMRVYSFDIVIIIEGKVFTTSHYCNKKCYYFIHKYKKFLPPILLYEFKPYYVVIK